MMAGVVMRISLLVASLALVTACGTTPAASTPIPTTGGVTATSTATATATTTAATGTVALNCTSPAQPLVTLTEGPYYKAGAPELANLRAAGVVGTPLNLVGYVVTRSCQPIANAKLDFWQADGAGNYDNSGYRLRGYVMTNAQGAYRLETVVPGLYPGRTEHIHFKVTAGGQTWTSQLFLPDVAQNASDSIYSTQMLIKLDRATSPITGTFTFVVNLP